MLFDQGSGGLVGQNDHGQRGRKADERPGPAAQHGRKLDLGDAQARASAGSIGRTVRSSSSRPTAATIPASVIKQGESSDGANSATIDHVRNSKPMSTQTRLG